MYLPLAKLKHPPQLPLLLLGTANKEFLPMPPAGLIVHKQAASATEYGTVLAFLATAEELAQTGLQALLAAAADNRLWFAYPKKSSGIKTNIHRDTGWHYLVEQGYGAVAAISLNDTWSALRFKPEAEVNRQGAYRTNQPVTRIPRTVETPEFIETALANLPQEKAFFESLAYTYRKEYISWLNQARRPQTHQQRLQQFLELLSQKKKTR